MAFGLNGLATGFWILRIYGFLGIQKYEMDWLGVSDSKAPWHLGEISNEREKRNWSRSRIPKN